MNKNQKSNDRNLEYNRVEHQISSKLHWTRLHRHYSFKRLHNMTKIQVKYLVDLDKGYFTRLPGNFYVRAFIKKYADSIGLNGNELLNRYNDKLPDPQDPHYINQISSNELLERVNQQHRFEKHTILRRYIPLVASILVILVVLFGIWLIASSHHKSASIHNNHSTVSVSGEPVRNSRRHNSKLRGHLIKVSSKEGKTIIYKIPAARVAHCNILALNRNLITIKCGHRLVSRLYLNSKHRRFTKVSLRNARKLSFKIKNGSKVKIKINGYSLKNDSRSRGRVIILKINKK